MARLSILLLLLSPAIHATNRTKRSSGDYLSKVPHHFGFSPLTFPDAASRVLFENDDDGREKNQPIRFGDEPSPSLMNTLIFPKPSLDEGQQQRFQDNNEIEETTRAPMKIRKRRKKARQHFPGYPSLYMQAEYPVPQYPHALGPYRPQRRPPAASALDSIVDALTSIARYDDLQCVSRMLCEAASGKAPVDGSGFLSNIMDIQPLITLLAAYNGVTSSPLFVFGRAVFLGMTSGAKSTSCRQAYPQCPTETEKLVEYLNNYNGGFFRFFKGGAFRPYPEQNFQQNLQPNFQQNYQPDYQQINQVPNPGSYGLLPGYPSAPYQPSYGFRLERPVYKSLDDNDYDQPKSDTDIEDRILNLPERNIESLENEIEQKLHQDYDFVNLHDQTKYRTQERDRLMVSKKLRFPAQESNREGSPFSFPDQQINGNNENDHHSAYSHGHDGEDLKRFYGSVPSHFGGDFQFVYIVRGNQDPRYPEVVRVVDEQVVQ